MLEQIQSLSYDDYLLRVKELCFDISNYEEKNDVIFNSIVVNSISDNISGNILANELKIPTVYWCQTKESKKNTLLIPPNLNKNENHNVLIYYSILNIDNMNELITDLKIKYPNWNIYLTYSFNLVSNKFIDIKLNIDQIKIIKGIDSPVDIRLPWDVAQFTITNQLDKFEYDLDRININKNDKSQYHLGFSSEEIRKEVLVKNKILKILSSEIFQINEKHNENLNEYRFYKVNSLDEYSLKNEKIINEKIEFIEKNCFTHFIESNLMQCVIIASKVKLCNIVFYDDGLFYDIHALVKDRLIINQIKGE